MAGVSVGPHGTRRRHKHGPDEHGNPGKGCGCTECREASNAYDRHRHRMIAYGRWEPHEDAAGTRRRVEALMWNGHSLTGLASALGWSRQVLRHKMRGRRVSPASAAAVRALYDDLWDQPPPQGTPYERRAVTTARGYARERGWVPPLAWDEDAIDDPAAVPAQGWRRRSERHPAASPVAAAIRSAREQAAMSRPRLAAIVGVTASAVQWWEQGKGVPGEEHWVQLELTLGPLGVVREAGPEAASEASRAA